MIEFEKLESFIIARNMGEENESTKLNGNKEQLSDVTVTKETEGANDAEGVEETRKVKFADVWKVKPLLYRVLLIVALWTVYTTVVVTDAVYADSIGMFVNLSTSTLLHDVVPSQYVVILQTMVGVWQLFFLVYNTMATLSRFKLTELPLPVIPMYISALLLNLAVTTAMYLDSDLAVILISALISGILNVGAFFSIRATYTSPIPILPLCCYNPQVLFSTFMTYTSLYHICHYVSTFGHDTLTINLVMVSIFLSVLIILIAVDVIVLDKWMQRTWSPYISSIISTVYLATHNWGKGDVSVYLFLACTVILSLGFLIKLIRSAQLTFEKPFRKCYDKYQQRKEVEPNVDGEGVVVENGILRGRDEVV